MDNDEDDINPVPDLYSRERQIAQQQAYANALRGMPIQGGKMDWASQLARAVGGAGGGYIAGQAQRGQEDLGQAYRNWLDLERRRRRGAPTQNLAIGEYGPALG